MNFYLCSGRDPNHSSDLHKKVNIVLVTFPIISVLLHIVVRVKIYAFKWKDASVQNKHNTANFKTNFENQSLSDFSTNVVMVGLTCIGVISVTSINNLNPAEANVYPHYLSVYWIHCFGPFIFGGVFSITYYLRHPPLRTAIFRELRERWTQICPVSTHLLNDT